jgi:hypothetical protein
MVSRCTSLTETGFPLNFDFNPSHLRFVMIGDFFWTDCLGSGLFYFVDLECGVAVRWHCGCLGSFLLFPRRGLR